MALIDIGSRKQLFVDSYLIESLTRAKQVMNPAEKAEHNPVLRPERPWEGNDVRPNRVVFDPEDQIFKMWYLARAYRAHRGPDEIVVEGEEDPIVCLATSKDGISWERPELGLVEFVPVITDRCVMSSLDAVGGEKLGRWRRIIAEAAEQSRRGRLPQLRPVTMFPQACELSRRADLSFVPWEEERTLSLRQLLRPGEGEGDSPRPFSVNIFVGPEGGLTQAEIDQAKRFGIMPVTLGPRILRAETAGLVAATAVLYELGDLE